MATIIAAAGGGTWDASSGTAWVGGVAPTAADDVTLTATGGAITIATGAVCRSLNCTGYTSTLTHPAATTLTIGDGTAGTGSVALKLVAGMTYTLGSATANLTFASTSATVQTITCGGKAIPSVTYNGVGGKWQYADNVSSSSLTTHTLTNGTLDMNGKTVSCGVFTTNNSNTRTLTLGAASLTCNFTSGTTFNATSVTGLTVTANTATITLTGASTTFTSAALNWNGASVVLSGSGSQTLNSNGCTFANVTRTGTAVFTDSLSLIGSITCSSTFTATGNSINNRLLVQSSVVGTARTITAATVSLTNVDFEDITAAGVASPFTGTSLGNCLGNSNITFTTATGTTNGAGGVKRFWVGGTGNWSDTTHWSTSTGGATGASVPLSHDSCYFDANSMGGSSQTVTLDMPRVGNLVDTTGSTGTGNTISVQNLLFSTCFGSWTMAGTMTVNGSAGSGTMTMGGRSTHTITSNGSVWLGAISIVAPGGTYTLQDSLSTGNNARTFTLSNGTFDANGFDVTFQAYSISATMTTVKMGSGTWNITRVAAQTSWSMLASAGVIQCQTSTIRYTVALTGSQTFAGGGATYYNLTADQAGGGGAQGAIIITGSNTFNTITVTAGKNLTITNGTTQIVSNLVTSGTNWGYQYLQSVGSSYVSIPDSSATSWAGDFSIRVRLAADAWAQTNMNIGAHETTGSTGYAWGLNMNASSKQPTLGVSSNGTTVTTATSSAAVGFADGAIGWLRVDWRASDGRTQFFTSSDVTNDPTAPTWTQLGTNQTANVGAIFDSPAVTTIGAANTTNTPVFNGKFYRFTAYSDLTTTTKAFDVDFTTKTLGADTFTESSSNAATVTVNGLSAQLGDGRVYINSALAGTAGTISKSGSNISIDYAVIKDSTVAGTTPGYAGANSRNVSGNTNWTFTAPANAARMLLMGIG